MAISRESLRTAPDAVFNAIYSHPPTPPPLHANRVQTAPPFRILAPFPQPEPSHDPNHQPQRLVHLLFHSRPARLAGGRIFWRHPAALCRRSHVGSTRLSRAARRLYQPVGARLQASAVCPKNVSGMARHPARCGCRRALPARHRDLPRIPAYHQRSRRNQPVAIPPRQHKQQTRHTRRPRQHQSATALPEAGRLNRALPPSTLLSPRPSTRSRRANAMPIMCN